MNSRLKEGLFMLFVIVLSAVLFILFPVASTAGAREALILCGSSVVGSIFPFMVVSKMIVNADLIRPDNKILCKIASFFHISPHGVLALILGLVCGYPMGAKTAADLCEKGQISKREASFLLAFCNNGGPAFVIAAVGAAFFGDAKAGVLLFVSHLLGSLMTGGALSLFFKNDTISSVRPHRQRIPFSLLLTEAIRDSCMSMLNVAGVIVFFAAFFSVLQATNVIGFLCSLFGEQALTAQAVLLGLFEITSGLKAIAPLSLSPVSKLCLAELILSLGGLSIYCQSLSFTAPCHIKTAPYLIGKALSSFLSASLMCIALTRGVIFLCFTAAVYFLLISAIQKPCKIVQIYRIRRPQQIRDQQKRRRTV